MLQIVNGGLGSHVFSEVEPRVGRILQALATYVAGDEEPKWSVRILRPFAKPAKMSSDKPLSLRPDKGGLPLFLSYSNGGGAAFECSIDGINRGDLGIAIDALNSARGKAKKQKQEKVADVLVVTNDVASEMSPMQELAEVEPPVVVAPDSVITEFGAVAASEIDKIKDFMTDLWVKFSERTKGGTFFAFNHEITPLIVKHFKVRGKLISQFYAVRLYTFGNKIKTDSSKTDGWNFDLAKVEAFCNENIGMPKRCVSRHTVNLPPLPTGEAQNHAVYPELHEPTPNTAGDVGTLSVVLTGEQVAAQIDAATSLDVNLIEQASKLVAKHETHKVNATSIEADIQKMEADRATLEISLAEINAKIADVSAGIGNACIRLTSALEMVERTRLPKETIDKLTLMRQQIDALFAVINKQ